MADTSGMQDIRGLDIDKLAKGYADEELVLKRYVRVVPTKARTMRWYKKTAGFVDTTDTDGITASQIANISDKSRPFVAEQSWTRTTSYVRKYMVESPWISIEDIRDTDIDILASNVRDLVRAVAYQVDARIGAALIGDGSIGTGAATADGWDDAATGDPIHDLLLAKETIRASNYNPEGAILYINQVEYSHLVEYLINVKGSSIPSVASEAVKSGVVMEILGLKVVVSSNAPTDEALVFVPQRAASWRAFVPLSTAVLDEPGIGKKIRVWEEGECLVTDPAAIYRITDTAV